MKLQLRKRVIRYVMDVNRLGIGLKIIGPSAIRQQKRFVKLLFLTN